MLIEPGVESFFFYGVNDPQRHRSAGGNDVGTGQRPGLIKEKQSMARKRFQRVSSLRVLSSASLLKVGQVD